MENTENKKSRLSYLSDSSGNLQDLLVLSLDRHCHGKRGHGEGKKGPPKDDKSYKIDINQYIVGGEGMEGVTAGEVVMDSQPMEEGATLGSPLSINFIILA